MRVVILSVLLCALGLCIAPSAFAQPAAPASPPLFLREDWKHTPDIAEHAVVQDSVTTPDVELKLYGQTPQNTDPDRQGRAKDSGVYEVLGGGVTYIYTGPCLTPCAVALKDKNNYANLIDGLTRLYEVSGEPRWIDVVAAAPAEARGSESS